MRRRAEVRADDAVSVAVEVPMLVPAAPRIAVGAETALAAPDG
jgi:hypothetical protein